MEGLGEISKPRKFIRARATKLCDRIDRELEMYDKQKCLLSKNKLSAILRELNDSNSVILNAAIKLKISENELEQMVETNDEYNDRIEEAISRVDLRYSEYASPRNNMEFDQRESTSLFKSNLKLFSKKNCH